MVNEKQARTQAEANAQVGAAFLVAGVNEITRLEADLAAANATIEALQADLAGTAELLLREQALAESRALALATMREALEATHDELAGIYARTWDSTNQHIGRLLTSNDLLLAQPDAAAALAGAILEAADRMADGAIFEWHAGTDVVRQWCRTCGTWPLPPSTAFLHREDCPVDAYRRARAALRGDGAVEEGHA